MPAAFALGMNSGRIILREQCRAVCGPPGIAFSQMELGRQGADAAPASYGSGGAAGEELALSASLRSAALPKGEPLAWRQGFQLNCEVSSFARASPFGRGVTAGDGEGEDACEGQAVFVLAALTGDVPSPHCRAAMTERVPSREKSSSAKPAGFAELQTIKTLFPLKMARAQRRPFKIDYTPEAP